MVELEKDMLTVKACPKVVISRNQECPEGARYFEAPSMRKINGLYILVYSARITGLHYYYSRYPDKDFVYGGKIHSTSDVGINGHTAENPAYPVGNTHGGIVNINGQYYIFDHRLTNNSSYCRQGVAEPIEIQPDGKIRQVEATSCGLNGGPLIGKGTYPAYIACNLLDMNTYESKEDRLAAALSITQEGDDRECGPGQYLKGMKNGCIVGYKYFDFKDIEKFSINIRGNASGILRVSLKERDMYISEIVIDISKEDWTSVNTSIKIQNGVHALYFEFEGKGAFDILEFSLD
jgi:Glycosyl hydrolases family 43.